MEPQVSGKVYASAEKRIASTLCHPTPPTTVRIAHRNGSGREEARSSRPDPYERCARRRQCCLMVTLSTDRVTVSGPAELDM